VRQVVITGSGCAGPWGVSEVPPEHIESGAAHPAALEHEPTGLSPRQRRYLGRNARLAIAACRLALESAGYPGDEQAREALACWIATTRGATDPETTLEMIRAARRAAGAGAPLAREALDVYNRRRVQVQYLLSMETAVAGHVTAALGARGPTHVVTTPGPAGGAQALARAVRCVERGEAPAALACAVTTAEDPLSTAELLRAAGGPATLVEGAGAVLIEHAGRARGCAIRVAREALERPTAGGAVAAMPLWEIARRRVAGERSSLAVRGFPGHRFVLELGPAREGP